VSSVDARRSNSAFIWLGVALLVAGFFVYLNRFNIH